MRAIHIQEAEADLPGLMKTIVRQHEAVEIQSPAGNAILVSEADWQHIQERLRESVQPLEALRDGGEAGGYEVDIWDDGVES